MEANDANNVPYANNDPCWMEYFRSTALLNNELSIYCYLFSFF